MDTADSELDSNLLRFIERENYSKTYGLHVQLPFNVESNGHWTLKEINLGNVS